MHNLEMLGENIALNMVEKSILVYHFNEKTEQNRLLIP